MNEGDPNNLLCGITIDVTPLYPTASVKKRCYPRLWEGDEIDGKLRSMLERGCIDSMTSLIKQQFTSPSYLRICVTTTADRWTDEGEDHEVFSLEIDVFGESALLDDVSDVVGDIATGEAVCDSLRPLLARFAVETISEPTLGWNVEVTEYGE